MILKNASFIVTLNPKKEVITDGAIYIEDSSIVDIGKTSEIMRKYSDDEIIDCKNKLIMPGLINTHTHAATVLMRGLGEDMELMEWLEKKIWPFESKLKEKDVYHASLLACIEMIKNGITCFNDMYFFMDSVAKACLKIGIRASLSWALIDKEIIPSTNSLENCKRFIKRWKNNELIIPSVGPHAIYTCSEETLLKAKEIADKYNTLLHIHLSETEKEVEDCLKKHGKRPAEYLNSIEFLDKNVIAAHCVWLNKKEIKILSEKGVKVSHCPISNMKLAVGKAMPLPEMLKERVIVSLGTDGAASNNSLDLFETMKFAALLHKHEKMDPTVTKAYKILEMATIDGARALSLEDKIGSIEEGKKPDLIILDINKAHWKPSHDVIANLVYSCKSSDVETVIINGKIVMKEKKILTTNEEKILKSF